MAETSSRMTEDTAKTPRPKAQLTELVLEHYKICTDPMEDSRVQEFKKIIRAKLKPQKLEDKEAFLQGLQDTVTHLFETNTKRSLSVLDALDFQVDKSKSEVHYPLPHRSYFKHAMDDCLTSNEAYLQRTLMMNTFHPDWLPQNPSVKWYTEETWKKCSFAGEMVEDKGILPRPKPDLVFSFAKSAFQRNVDVGLIPTELDDAISPDGRARAFPFLFFEVKKGEKDLDRARLNNLNNAAQALKKIARWYEKAKENEEPNKAKEWDASFRKIRIFTFAFNAQNLIVRLHRATQRRPGELVYFFSEFYQSYLYTRDQVCNLFNGIVLEYAVKELFPSLKAVFRKVTKQDEMPDIDESMEDASNQTVSDGRAVGPSQDGDDDDLRTEDMAPSTQESISRSFNSEQSALSSEAGRKGTKRSQKGLARNQSSKRIRASA